MPDDRYSFTEIARIIRESPSIDQGIALLHDLAAKRVPRKHPVWKILNGVRWAEDVPVVRDALLDRLTTCAPLETNGVYLGIDGLNMPSGSGIEMGCSTAYKPGSGDIEYIYSCIKYCDDLPFPCLGDFYTWYYTGEEGDRGVDTFTDSSLDNLDIEYPLCLGASAMVICEALKGIGAATLRGSATERCFAYGFHDGDMLRLGVATAKGFERDPSFV